MHDAQKQPFSYSSQKVGLKSWEIRTIAIKPFFVANFRPTTSSLIKDFAFCNMFSKSSFTKHIRETLSASMINPPR